MAAITKARTTKGIQLPQREAETENIQKAPSPSLPLPTAINNAEVFCLFWVWLYVYVGGERVKACA